MAIAVVCAFVVPIVTVRRLMGALRETEWRWPWGTPTDRACWLIGMRLENRVPRSRDLLRPAACALVLLILAALGSAAPTSVLRYDFEEATTEWFPSENDPDTASAAPVAMQAPSGRQALGLTGTFPGSVGVSYQPWEDWRGYTTLKVWVQVPVGAPKDIGIYVYLKDRQYLWYQTGLFRDPATDKPTVPLKPGTWMSATVNIGPGSTDWKPGDHEKSWYRTLYYPREFGVRFFSKTAWQGTVFVDDICLIAPATAPKSPAPPALRPQRNVETAAVNEKLELTFPVDREYDNVFNPHEVEVTGHFRTPSGRETRVPGFFYQGYRRTKSEEGHEKLIPVGAPSWKVRFSAMEPGPHEFYVTLRDDRGEARSASESFTAAPPVDPRGRIRVSRQDPRYFEFENGEFFFPQGVNMRDGGNQAARQRGTYDFDDFFPAFDQAGLQFARTWMCAWWAGIEWSDKYDSRYDNLGRYSMYNAWRLDHAVELAEANDLFIELTLNSHGQLRRDRFDGEWMYNPYSAANGGPCLTPSTIWTDPTAKEMFRRRYRYIVARWGYSRHIMSWDLWNEIDLIDAYGQLTPDVAAWHDEMTRYLRETDPWPHLITTHYCLHFSWDGGRSLWAVPNIDYVQADAYWPQKEMGDDISRGYGPRASIAKPYMVIEFGPQTAQIPGLTPAQIEGYFRIGLWSGTMTPLAAPPVFWYNDIWMRDRYAPHHAALAKFLAGEDRRGQGWTWINHDLEKDAAAPRPTPAELFVHAMKSPQATHFYVLQADRMLAGEAGRTMAPIQGATVDFHALPDGRYAAEFWDPYAGEVITTSEVVVAGGKTRVALPDFAADLACKLRRVG